MNTSDGISSSFSVNNVTYQFKICASSLSSVLQTTKCDVCYSDMNTNEGPFCYSSDNQKDIVIEVANYITLKKLLSVTITSEELLSSLEKDKKTEIDQKLISKYIANIQKSVYL